ncbi:helix-turn-helix domain-containing protein [Streptomyces sp. NPDC093261]|uniref:helix-turn-helix domain-containing protein n=1 Tax=Streptomyces sp. NPDC093261 TaxID=3366037 RepID=UPI003817B4A6
MSPRTRPLPPHGKRARYLRGCHCPKCTAAHSRYCKEYRLRTQRTGRMRAEVAQAAEHLNGYIAKGWTQAALAKALDVNASTLRDLLSGHTRTTDVDVVARMLAFDPGDTPPPSEWTDPTGTIRRICALAVIGWPIYRIAREIGLSVESVWNIIRGDQKVSRTVAARTAEVYAKRSRTPGPSAITRTKARKKGWNGPMAWDDIDDPHALPEPEPARSQKRSEARAEEIRFLAGFGIAPEEIARRVGCSVDYVASQLGGWRAPGIPRTKEKAA